MLVLVAVIDAPLALAADGAVVDEVEALHATARAADLRGEWTAAHAAWAALLERDPHGPRSEAARTRLSWIEARRAADGSLDSAEALARARTARDAGALRAIAAEAAAPAPVRAEAALWLALETPAEALLHTEPAWALRDALPVELYARLGRAHARALAQAGRTAEAVAAEEDVRLRVLGPSAAAANKEGEVDRVARARRRALLGAASWSVIAGFGVAAGLRAWRARARLRTLRPWGLVPLWVLSVGALGVAGLWDASVWRLAPVLVGGWSGIHLLAAASAGTAGPRMLVGALAALASLGVAFLTLQAHEALLWMGL